MRDEIRVALKAVQSRFREFEANFIEDSEELEYNLLVDNDHGIYVAQIFARDLSKDWFVCATDREILLEGPEQEWYEEAWTDVIESAERVASDGTKWFLFQTENGDLLEVPEEYLESEY